MRLSTYYCQSCGRAAHNVLTAEQAYSREVACGECGSSKWDDMPPDVTVSHAVGEEGTLDHFDRYVAGDR